MAFALGGNEVLVGLRVPGADADSRRIRGLALVPLDGGAAWTLPLPDGFDSGQVIRRGDRASLWQPVDGTATFLDNGEGMRTLVRRVDLASASNRPLAGQVQCA